MGERISGFIPGIVTDRADPDGLHRVRARLPGYYEEATPFWIWPGNVPGSSISEDGKVQGSCYPPPRVGSMIDVTFAWGEWDRPDAYAKYFPSHFTLGEDGSVQGPPSVFNPDVDVAKRRERVCIWEDDKFVFSVQEEGVEGVDGEHTMTMASKSGLTKVQIVRGGGQTGTGEILRIEGRAGIKIFAMGSINIDAKLGVEIQGRKVTKGGLNNGTI
jgi:hypothetical protein